MQGQCHRKALLVLAFLSACVLGISADCFVNVGEVTRMRSTPFYIVGTTTKLLIGNMIPDGAELIFACSGGSQLPSEVQTRCSSGVVQNYPTATCPGGALGAVVERIAKCPGGYDLYHVTYKFLGQSHPLYKVCYDERKKLTKYAIHEQFYSSMSAKRPFLYFTTDGVISGAVEAAYSPRNVEAKILELCISGINIDYNRRIKIDRGHLVPAGDFAYEIHKIDTFKLINAVPQFASNNGDGGNWNEIEKQVRDMARARPKSRVIVITGVEDILELQRSSERSWVEVFLGDRNTVPIPKFMFKIISIDGVCEAVYMYNNPYDNPNVRPRLGCEMEGPCHFDRNLPNGNTRLWGEFNCCDVRRLRAIVLPELDLSEYCNV